MYMAFDAVSFVEDVSVSYEDLDGREDEVNWKKPVIKSTEIKQGLKWKCQKKF